MVGAPAPRTAAATAASAAAGPAPREAGRRDADDEGLVTGEAVGLAVRPASLIVRAAGSMIDWLAYALLLAGAAWVISLASGGLDTALTTALGTVAVVGCLVVVPAAVETASHGRSLGRWALGVRIVRADGGAASLRHAFVRALMGVVEIFMTFGGLAALVSLLDPRSRRLGDLLAGTYAQHERVPRVPQLTPMLPEPLTSWAATADVARMPDPLTRRIAAFLAHADRLTPASRAARASELLAEAGRYVWPLPDAPDEAVLAGVAALRRARDAARLADRAGRLASLEPQLTGLPHAFPDR